LANYFKNRRNSGFVEGLNNLIKVVKRRCYGIFKTETLFQRWVKLQERGYAVASCGRDGGRPTEFGHQRSASNHLRRLLSKAMVVSA